GRRVVSANETPTGAVPNPLAAGERARQTWFAVQATVSPKTSGSEPGAHVASCGAFALLRQTVGPPSPGPRLVWRARPRRRSSLALPSHASAAYACARSLNIARKLAVAADRVRALLLPAAAAPPGSSAAQAPGNGSTTLQRQSTNSAPGIASTPPIREDAGWRRAPPSRRRSRPPDLNEIAQETAPGVEQLRQEIGLARWKWTSQRARHITAHGKAQPAREDYRSGKASPL